MATPERTTGLTYADLERMYPQDPRKIELIDGVLVMAPSPILRHERVAMEIAFALMAYAKTHGGEVFANVVDVYVSETNVLQPDVVYRAAADIDADEVRIVKRATLVVEVSSPSTRRRDLGRKMELYAELGIPEYWFVDLDADSIDVYRLAGDAYGPPAASLARGETLTSPNLPGFELEVAEALG